MSAAQVDTFIQERKWDYRGAFSFIYTCIRFLYVALIFLPAFGFAAALLEGLPLVGFVFTVSNQIGAAMWAHGEFSSVHPPLDYPHIHPHITDLEKRQHYVAELKAHKIQ
jgi:hypothetical protein